MRPGTIIALVALALPAPAGAQVFYDPESPAGKQYQLPVERERDQSRGTLRREGGAPRPAGATREQLFGQGVRRRSGAAATTQAPLREAGRAPTPAAPVPPRAAGQAGSLATLSPAALAAAERAATAGAGGGVSAALLVLAALSLVGAVVLRRTG